MSTPLSHPAPEDTCSLTSLGHGNQRAQSRRSAVLLSDGGGSRGSDRAREATYLLPLFPSPSSSPSSSQSRSLRVSFASKESTEQEGRGEVRGSEGWSLPLHWAPRRPPPDWEGVTEENLDLTVCKDRSCQVRVPLAGLEGQECPLRSDAVTRTSLTARGLALPSPPSWACSVGQHRQLPKRLLLLELDLAPPRVSPLLLTLPARRYCQFASSRGTRVLSPS